MRDRDLVRLHWPESRRPALDTLLALDDRLADAAILASQPALAAIKLAWWRDQLQALDTDAPVNEPLLLRVAAELLPAGLSGAELSSLAEAWTAVTDEAPDAAPRGQALFRLLGRLLNIEAEGGEAFSRADLARRTGEAAWLERTPTTTSPRPARPITMLDALGRRDAHRFWPPEAEATPGRSWTLVRHRLTGR